MPMYLKLKVSGNPKLIEKFILFLYQKYSVFDIVRIDDVINNQVVFATVTNKE